MNFSFINRKKVTKLTNTHPSKQVIPSPERRKFVKTMGLGVLAANPIVKTLGSLTESSFEIKHSDKYLAVLRDDIKLWEINPHYFGHNTRIEVEKESAQIRINARNLQIVQTHLQFDLHVVLYRKNTSWLMRFTIPQFRIDKTVPFMDWLNGYTGVDAPVTLNTKLLSLNTTDNVTLSGTFDCSITRDWEMRFIKRNAVKSTINEQIYYADKLIITPDQDVFSNLVSQNLKTGARIILSGSDNWHHLLSQLEFNKASLGLLTDDKFSVNISVGTTDTETVFKTLWISKTQGNLRVKSLHTAENQLNFSNYFYLSDYSQQEMPTFFLSAKMPEEEQWLNNSIGTFALSTIVRIS